MIKGSSEEPDLEGSGVAEEDLQCKDPCLEIHSKSSKHRHGAEHP